MQFLFLVGRFSLAKILLRQNIDVYVVKCGCKSVKLMS